MYSKDTTDNIKPNEKWTFDNKVSDCFDDMLRRSIPDYNNMRNAIFKVAKNSTKGKTLIDLGSSLGRSFELFADDGYSILSCEISKPMLKKQNELFGDYKNVLIREANIISDYPDVSADVVLSILTIQFTPIEHRQKILKNIFKSLNPEGVFILVEKVIGNTFSIDEALVKAYYEVKKQNGYTNEQIIDKRKSLEGVLVPITSDFNVQLLKGAGFSEVDCFWRYLNFAGFIAKK